MNYTELENKVKAWELPSLAEAKILENPQLCQYLLKEKSKFPLPPFYIPYKIQFLFDNKIVHEIDCDEDKDPDDESLILDSGRINLVLSSSRDRSCLPDFESASFIEIKFDNDCALFFVGQYRLIDRISSFITTKIY